MITIHARNIRALGHLVWPLHDVSVLTGPNGAGKTTVLFVLRALRAAFDRDISTAIRTCFDGGYNLRTHGATADANIELGVDVDDLRWRIRLVSILNGGYGTEETLTSGEHTIMWRDGLGSFSYRGEMQNVSTIASEKLAVRLLAETFPDDAEVSSVAECLRNITVFMDPNLRSLRENGSRITDNRHLRTDGLNVLTMLRTWRDRRADESRFRFVDQGLRSAFPGVYTSLDFADSGQTLSSTVYRDGLEVGTPLSHEANGLLAMMMLLTQIAAAEDGGVVAIDEPEHALHPFAIRTFVRLTRARAKQHRLSVILTTHSPVLLDAFQANPEQIFVLEKGSSVHPVRLDQMRDREWLSRYTLGELYVNGQFATNEDS